MKTFEIGNSPQEFLALVALSFARIFSFVYLVPFFGGEIVPLRAKIALTTALLVVVYPILAADGANVAAIGSFGFVALLLKEAFVGLTLGFVAASAFEAVRAAGRIVDLQSGLLLSEQFAPEIESRPPPLGQFKFYLAILIFLSIGAHHFFLSAFLKSFAVIPAAKFPAIESGWSPAAAFVVQLTAAMFAVGVQLAMPVIVTLLLTDLFFGIVNRTAPQLNVFFLSLPVKAAVALAVVAVALPFLLERFSFAFGEAYKAFEMMIRFFSFSLFLIFQ